MKTIHIFGWGRPRDGGEVESPAVERDPERCFLRGLTTPHWMWFWGTHSKISAMGPEFLAAALRAITVSGPSTVNHLVFTPILLFPYCNPTGFSIGFSQTSPSSPGHRWCLQWQACISHTRRIFPRSLAWNPLSIMMWMRTCGQTHKTGLKQT